MENLEKLVLIFERDFVNQDEDIKEVQSVELEVLVEEEDHIIANVNLTVLYTDDEIGMVEITESAYDKKYLSMIAENEKYKQEISK